MKLDQLLLNLHQLILVSKKVSKIVNINSTDNNDVHIATTITDDTDQVRETEINIKITKSNNFNEE